MIESDQTLCKELDIIDVDLQASIATWATGERIDLKIIHQSNHIEKFYDFEH